MEAEPESRAFSYEQVIKQAKNKPELISLNQVYQENVGSECGYCHKEDTSFSWSFIKNKMLPITYQLFMERGWRRCGTYYYKPNVLKSCCKLLTHRLEVSRFRPKRDQKKAVKRVITIAYEQIQPIEHEQIKENVHQGIKKSKKQQKKAVAQIKQQTINQLTNICDRITQYLKGSISNLIPQLGKECSEQLNFNLQSKLRYFVSKDGDNSDFYSNYVMLFHGLNKKIFTEIKINLIQFVKIVKTSIENLNPITFYKVDVERGGYLLFKKMQQNSMEFEVLGQKPEKISQSQIREEKDTKQGSFSKIFSSIKQRIIQKVHGDGREPESEKMKEERFQLLKPDHKYKGELEINYNKIKFGKIIVEIVPAEENVDSFKLYQLYSKDIHEKKQKSMSSYVNFLCLQALEFKQQQYISSSYQRKYIPSFDPSCKHQKETIITTSPKKLLGCYHMKYYLQGKLIGIGVVDIVQSGLSSVYFFYDPTYKEQRLGVFSSIIQIEYVRWMQLSFPQFKYYYMGFYIQNSQKMNYKADYMPCQVLCPLTYHFVDLTQQVKNKIIQMEKGSKDIRLADKQVKVLEDMNFGKDLGPFIDRNIKLVYNGRNLVLKDINPQFFVHILKILKINVPVWGRTLFDVLTLAL